MDPIKFQAEIARVTWITPKEVTRPYAGVLAAVAGDYVIRHYGPNYRGHRGHPWAVLKTVGAMKDYPFEAPTLDRAWTLATN